MRTLNWLHKWDVICIHKLLDASIHSKLLPVSRWISKSGDGWLYALFGLSSLIFTKGESSYFWALALGFAIERPLYYILKNTLKRNRPYRVADVPHYIEPSDAFSFPSGHTSSAFLFSMITSVFIPVLTIPLLLWSLLIGLSRVVLGVHFPTDILVGVLMGYSISKFTIIWMGLI